ncbi:MAG: hypothetical protein MI741_22290 [Rhodospirillales bacterium]|nr:hypothetical protein [Rhodospirillales bacterium]
MRNNPAVLLIALVSFGQNAAAQVVYDNGTVNNRATLIDDNVEVKDSSGGTPTTLNIQAGGSVGDWIVGVVDASIVNVDGSDVEGFIELFDSGSASVVSGFARQGILALDSSTVSISGGTVGNTA